MSRPSLLSSLSRLPLQWRIALAYTALIFATMGIVSLYLVNFIRNSYISNLHEQLAHDARLLGETSAPYFAAAPDLAGLRTLAQRAGDILDSRVTVIARDGTVLADSWRDPAGMENHALRPEVMGALESGLGRNIRVSETVGQEMVYVAVPVLSDAGPAGVVRVAVPTSMVWANVRRIVLTIAFSALVVALLSVGLGYLLARRTSRSVRSVTEGARRLARGDLDYRVQALSSDETQDLADAFNSMATTIRAMIRDLSGERNKLSAVLDTMADGVVAIGPDGYVTLMNRPAESLLDVRSKLAVGSRFAGIVRDFELQQLVSRALSTGQQQMGEVELLRRRRFLSAIATPIIEDGSHGVLLTLHDLTRIRQVETTRKQFVSNVSHELRSPLASIKAMVETLQGGALDEPQVSQDFLQRIHRDLDRMTAMVNDLLELSRLESGQVTLKLVPMDLRPLVEDVCTGFQAQARSQGISLEAALPEDLPLVLGEEEKLRQVLVNLLDNALKFTPGPGSVAVSAIALDNAVEVRVSDTGIGIPPEHLPHVFERFYKVDRARSQGGTGLGLAIVKHIVQAHGGDVRVESQEGSGSTFSFTVPLAPSATQD